MTKSTFNVDAFLGTEYKEANDTHLIPLERGEYQIQCLDLKGKKIEAKETGDEFTLVEVFWHVLGEEAKNKTGLEKPLAKQTLFLELTPSGAIDFGKGKNVGLGRLREALGQNKIGKPWSFNMIRGSLAWGFVDPEPDAEDPLTVRNIVKRVSAVPKMQEEAQETATKQKRR